MSDLELFNTSILEVIISSKNECVFIRDLDDLTVQIIIKVWCASIKVHSKCLIASNNSRHTSSCRFDLNFEMEETGSPGIVCIVCHQLLGHSSKYGTNSMGKHLLAKAHIAKLNKLAKLEVTILTSSTVDETALTIQMKHTSEGIKIVSSQRKFIFDIQVDPY